MADENKPGTGDTGKNPLLILLIITNIITMSAVAYFQWRFMELESKRPSLAALLQEGKSGEGNDEVKSEVMIKEEKLLQLESFTVNLAQGDGPRRYLRLDAVLKMSDDAKKEEFEARKPQIRDTIISILNTKRADDLLKREGKDYLKEEIKSSINSYLIDGRVEDVYYISFQIN